MEMGAAINSAMAMNPANARGDPPCRPDRTPVGSAGGHGDTGYFPRLSHCTSSGVSLTFSTSKLPAVSVRLHGPISGNVGNG